MYQLILVLSFVTSACGVPNPSITSNTFQPITRVYYPDGKEVRAVQTVSLCSPYRDVQYTKLDKYPTYRECMKRVARVGEQNDLSAVCVRA